MTFYPPPEPQPPLCYGTLQLPTRFLLSPLAGYTNLPFRRIVREIGGVGLGTTDLVNARGLLEGSEKTWQLVETCPEDSPFAVQIFGREAWAMREAAQFLESRGVDSIDINMGCPVDRITKGGAGASMMCRTDETVSLVESVVQAVKIPVSVKMRLGWDESQLTAPKFARLFEEVGVVAIAIHGRTRAQGFTGLVNLTGIRKVVEAVERIPVIGNGDVRNIPDARADAERYRLPGRFGRTRGTRQSVDLPPTRRVGTHRTLWAAGHFRRPAGFDAKAIRLRPRPPRL